MTSPGLSTLYLCYFGLREPLVQTQVLPYLRGLAGGGVRVHLLTFEPELKTSWGESDLREEAARLRAGGIEWFYLPYHKRPALVGTCYDILAGARTAVRLSSRVDVLHARAHTAMAMALLARKWKKFSLVFDIRGLMAEEYADAGIWSEKSVAFRLVKFVERVGVRRADQVVVLTHKMRDWLVGKKLAGAEKIEVIPCCVDFSRFGIEGIVNRENGSERFEVIYAGSVAGLYLLEEMGRFFLHLQSRQKNALLRILTTSPAGEAAEVLRRVGVREGDYWIGRAAAQDVPSYLRRARLGLSFRKATFSQIAASPTKIPEYLSAGLPVVCNAGVGDTDDLLRRERVGIVINSFTAEEYAAAATRALALLAEDNVAARCAAVAKKYFDLTGVGRAGYGHVYRRLANQSEPAAQRRT